MRRRGAVDAHLHLAQWFSVAAAPLLEEMEASGIAQGVIMAVYGPTNPFGTDPNQDVASLVRQSNGTLWGLASVNTTGNNWNDTRVQQLNQLTTFLGTQGFVGTKLAPPHTRVWHWTVGSCKISWKPLRPVPVRFWGFTRERRPFVVLLARLLLEREVVVDAGMWTLDYWNH